MILLDTNVLGRLTDSKDPQCQPARRAVHQLLAKGRRVVIVPQNLYEFWAVATRRAGPPPAGSNGLGMTATQASRWIAFFQRRFAVLPDRADLLSSWHDLVKTFDVTGFKSHDARLVAAMQSYGITELLTFNASDFKPFPIALIDPNLI